MAGISILFVLFLMLVVVISTVLAIVFFIISMVLWVKNNHANGKKAGKMITLVLSGVFLIPLVILLLGMAMSGMRHEAKVQKTIASFENKIVVKGDDWKDGFEWDGRNLVPVYLFGDYRNYDFDENIKEFGALVDPYTNNYHKIYRLQNDSGCEMYYVHVVSEASVEYYSRVFVDENDYNQVMDFYDDAKLRVSVLWTTAPKETGLCNQWTSLRPDFMKEDRELIQMVHEALADKPASDRSSVSLPDDAEEMNYVLSSEDRALSINIHIYANEKDMLVYVNRYKVSREVTAKYRDMLADLMEETKEEAKHGTDRGF